MSLISALNLGSNALAVSQAAVQTTGNNIANAGNANYVREDVQLTPGDYQQLSPGIFLGSGVDLTAIQRQVDGALTGRLNSSVSDSAAASTTEQWLGQVESTFNALNGNDLSSQLSTFYGAWSSLANNPADSGLRQVVLQDGNSVASTFSTLQQQLGTIQSGIVQSVTSQVNVADQLSGQIASLNNQIVSAQGGSPGTANGLLDQRDAAVKSLSQLMNITTVLQPDGSMNVYVGSEPLVTGAQSSGVAAQTRIVNGKSTEIAVFKNNNQRISINSGQLGALASVQSQVGGVEDQLDTLANNFIYEVNKIHSSGQGTVGYSSVTSTNVVADPTKALNSTAAGLPFAPQTGSFVVHVKDTATGLEKSTLVQVNLAGQPTDTTLNSLSTTLAAIPGVSAAVSGGRLTIAATSSAQQITFSQDSSGVLAALGVNSFFTGKNASTIAVNSTLTAQPTLLAAAQNGDVGGNQAALAIAALGTQSVAALQGATLNDTYTSMINGISVSTAAAKSDATSAQSIQDTLQSQRNAVSGVSLDEETVKLMQQQTAYQGAARFVSVVDQMMQTLLGMVQ